MMKRIGTVSGLRAFTLVELLITTAIIGVLSSTMMVALNRAQTAKDVESDVRAVSSAIRATQNYALTGKNLLGASSSEKPCMFRLRTVAGEGVLYIEQSNVDTVTGACSGTFSVGDVVTLSRNVTLVSDRTVRFPVPHAEPQDEGGELISGFIDFGVSKKGMAAYSCVYPLGRIEDRPVGKFCD